MIRQAPLRTRRMLASLRGLGDTSCTPQSCAGPYDNPAYNYGYWTTQAVARGVIVEGPEAHTEAVNVTEVEQAMGAPAVTYEQLLAAAGVVNCGGETSVGTQWACVQANQPRLNAIQDLKVQTQDNPSAADLATLAGQFGGTLAYTPSAITTPVSPGPATPVAMRGGSLSFTTSRGGSVLQPGDTWTIRITGASPGLQVVVVGGKNGAQDRTPMGTTDASGNFALSGQITADQVGSWSETWFVSSVQSGSFSFQVVASGAPAIVAQSNAPGATVVGDGAAQSNAPAATSVVPAWFTETMVDSIPNWALLGAAAVAVFMFMKKGK